MTYPLDDDNFEEFAIANYINPNCVSVLEFLDDLKKIRYVKRLLNKYRDRQELRERLILNHIIFLSNVFGIDGTVNMLRYKVGENNVVTLNTFFILLNYIDIMCEYDEDLLFKLREKI
jgi:hypothetical protein